MNFQISSRSQDIPVSPVVKRKEVTFTEDSEPSELAVTVEASDQTREADDQLLSNSASYLMTKPLVHNQSAGAFVGSDSVSCSVVPAPLYLLPIDIHRLFVITYF